MKPQDILALQEAYMEVVENQQLDEGKVAWDNPRSPLESGLTPREKNRAKRKSIGDKENPRYKKLQAAQDTQKGTKVSANKRHKFEKGYDGDTLGQERRLTGDHKHYMPDKKRMKHYTTSLKEPKESYDIYDIILSHLLDEGYADTEEAATVIMVNMSEEWREEIMEGMTMKDFKANRRKLQRREASIDAEKRGHVSRDIITHGRKYSPDEAKSNRANMSDYERSTRKSFAMNPDQVGNTRETADKTKNPKKLRKQTAMGEH